MLTQTDKRTDAQTEPMSVDSDNKAQAVDIVSTEDVKITSNLEEKMSDTTNRAEFNAMFHGQDDDEDEDMDSMQVIVHSTLYIVHSCTLYEFIYR